MLFQTNFRLLIFILISAVSKSHQQRNNFPVSPCANVFLYKYDGQEWYGEIKTPTILISQQGSALLEVTFTLRITQNIQLRHASISLITDSDGEHRHWFKFRVTFPQRYPLPKLVEISFGNRLLCRGAEAIPRPNNSIRIIKLSYVVRSPDQKPFVSHFSKPFNADPAKTSPNTSHHQNFAALSNDTCGIPKVQLNIRSLVFGGEIIQRGEWPWLVGIYLTETFGVSFACGGNLISSKAVITAAHCVKSSNKIYRPREVLLYFGHYNRLDWTEVDSIRSRATEIFIHPDYKHQRPTKDADLAILITEEAIQFNNFIQPVCLWSTEFNKLISKGTIVGWGRDSMDRIASTHPRKIELPIVEVDQCREESEAIASALSNRTFCAGTLDGNGPCHGDSGSGLMIHHDGRWTLRGIVSAGLSDAMNGMCKLTDYIIFTDVSKFSTWIFAHMTH